MADTAAESKPLESPSPAPTHNHATGSDANPLASHCGCGAHTPPDGWKRHLGPGSEAKLRIGFIFGGLLVLFAGLSVRLFYLQAHQGKEWRARAETQRVGKELKPGPRGPIEDVSGLPLAYGIPRETVIADMHILKDPSGAAEKLAPLLKISEETLLDRMASVDIRRQRVVVLSRDQEESVADSIRKLKLRGIGFEDSFKRTYPQGNLACHIVGWSGLDGGMEGLELELNSILAGTPGYTRYYRDAARRPIALNDGSISPAEYRAPRDGLAVTLTIDARIQQIAEEQLVQIHDQFSPKSATCVVLDVSTGAVLAMACTPPFDPNSPAKSPAENRRNRVITDLYEPGSTYKTFVAAMALEKKLWRRTDSIFCENGAWRIGYRTLHDSHAYGSLSMDDVISKSSNIGAAKIAQRIGIQGLYDLSKNFGFGTPTGINLPGEAQGRVRPRKVWTNDSTYSIAMGHEISCTPLQIATAFSSVVNGGVLYRPKVVQRITNEQGEVLYTLKPQAARRVISEKTSQQMREMLARVVLPGGTGNKAFSTEYTIGGKTGTTKKIDPVTKTYSSTAYIGSFCGFAPVENPRVVCLVTVDEPHKGTGYYGGTVACPAAKEVIIQALRVLNVPPRSADPVKVAGTSGR
jgi:cell division protein FtsI (penicillin-binding protein 3)